jgi:2-methylcitrate dehydratase PrpD
MNEAKQAAVAELLGDWIAGVTPTSVPAHTREICRKLFVDVAGLCIAARKEDYIQATLGATEPGRCTAIGHGQSLDPFSAALINGTAAHGEDYDDTFEGGPVHSGAVIIPAVLAACEREGLGGDRLLMGIAVGCELLCRMSLVTPKAIHNAGFHPTAVFGTLAAAAGVAAALGLSRDQTVSAIGIAGSMASGIIEYLAEGAWTKRMHAGWAAQSGLRAALMARGGFIGPRTVLEGTHGFYYAFAPSVKPDFEPLLSQLGSRWVIDDIAFKPFACGTMTQPFIDCAIALAKSGVRAEEIETITCLVGEGTVHRLWEPLAVKHHPQTPYGAKFSTPFCMAIGFLDGDAGLAQFTQARIEDETARTLAGKISYEINPDDEYPRNFTGQLRAVLLSGEVREFRQPCMRGGAQAPMTTAEVEAKSMANARYGGWTQDQAHKLLALSTRLFDLSDMTELKVLAQ